MSGQGVAAVVLAAGASRRLGRPKQLIEHGGEALLARAVRLAREAGAAPIVVLLGADRAATRAAVPEDAAVLVVENDEWPEGIASSMRAGVRAVEQSAPESSGVLIMPCDQPMLSAEHLRALLAAFAAGGEACMVASTYAEVRGVPAIFPARAWDELKQLSGDVGARKLLKDAACPVIEVAFQGGDIDIDTPGDLSHLA